MSTSKGKIRDKIVAALRAARDPWSMERIIGHGTYELRDKFGNLKAEGSFTNLITQVGDQMYGEQAVSGFSSPVAQATGMQLGTGGDGTAAAKTGAGAALAGSYVSGSNNAFNSTPSSSLSGSYRRIQYVVTWGAGDATANDIDEVVIVNQSIATDSAAAAANTVSRAVLSPAINKASGDSLTVTWNHDLLGA